MWGGREGWGQQENQGPGSVEPSGKHWFLLLNKTKQQQKGTIKKKKRSTYKNCFLHAATKFFEKLFGILGCPKTRPLQDKAQQHKVSGQL